MADPAPSPLAAAVAAASGPAAPDTVLGELGAIRFVEPDPWPRFAWRWFSRGWRPFAGWALGLIALSDAYVRVYQIGHGLPLTPIDWVPITAFGATLVIARSYDKKEGTA